MRRRNGHFPKEYGLFLKQKRKQSTSATIAHEMVHQWFGNLVTMEFWDNIWLNEGFATFYKYGAIEEAFPGGKLKKLKSLPV